MATPPVIPSIIVESPVTQRKFPAEISEMKPPSSPAGTGPRNKVAVTHGHSMSHWVSRVAQEKKKAPSHRIISPEELQQHNKKEDGWIVLRGKVFDVTDYIDYHPGGIPILVKVLGQDGTREFNMFHNYVNFENILKNRQVGLYIPPVPLPAGSGKVSICCNICGGSSANSEHIPFTTFEQSDTRVTYQVECRCTNPDSKFWSVGISDKQNLMVRLVTRSPEIWLSHLKLTEKLESDKLQLTFENQFKKMTLTIEKPSKNKWKRLGSPQKSHNSILSSYEAPRDYYPATIVIKEELSTNNYLFGIHTGPEVRFGVPVGWHIMLRLGDTEKPYTPITWLTPEQESKYGSFEYSWEAGQTLFFLIKTHPEGKLTSPLSRVALSTPGLLEMGTVRGSFDTDFLAEIDRLILIAGGTGIAPFVNMIRYIRGTKEDCRVEQVVLIFSARTVDDLLWDDEWKSLTSLGWFHYIPYVTRDVPKNWTGRTNRMSPDSIRSDLTQLPKLADKKSAVLRGMGCGPPTFTDACLRIFQNLGMKDYEFLLFEG